jgi:hypothetical protein
MEKHIEIQLKNLSKNSINDGKKLEIKRNFVSKKRQVMLMISEVFVCGFHVFFGSFFLVEAGALLGVLIMLYTMHIADLDSNKKYSYGYSRSVSIGRIFCYFLMLVVSLGDLYFEFYLNLVTTDLLFHGIMIIVCVVQIYALNVEKMISVFLYWSLANHIIGPFSMEFKLPMIISFNAVAWLIGSYYTFETGKELMESTPVDVSLERLKNSLEQVSLK